MSDPLDKAKRSWVMAQVRSTGNKSTELKAAKLLREHGIKGWRRHYPIAGKPDFVFPKAKVALFIDGCFWHGHTCRVIKPTQNADYWKAKIERNMRRDREVNKTLKSAGWSVVRIWECELKKNKYQRKLKAVQLAIAGRVSHTRPG